MDRLFRGRMNRSTYLLVNMVVLLIVVIASRPDVAHYLDTHQSTAALWGAIIGIPLLIWQFATSARRFHDIGRSGWYSLLIILPFVQFIMLFIPGTKGDNSFGPEPTQTFDLSSLFVGRG